MYLLRYWGIRIRIRYIHCHSTIWLKLCILFWKFQAIRPWKRLEEGEERFPHSWCNYDPSIDSKSGMRSATFQLMKEDCWVYVLVLPPPLQTPQGIYDFRILNLMQSTECIFLSAAYHISVYNHIRVILTLNWIKCIPATKHFCFSGGYFISLNMAILFHLMLRFAHKTELYVEKTTF